MLECFQLNLLNRNARVYVETCQTDNDTRLYKENHYKTQGSLII